MDKTTAIAVIGLSHKTAPLETRERVSFPSDRLARAYGVLAQYPAIHESLILSTCNRVEIFGIGTGVDSVTESMKKFLYEAHDIRPGLLEGHHYEKRGFDAVRHIFRVAGGLDSMVIGESQILKQIRNAYAEAASAGAAGPRIQRLVTDSIRAGKKARALTGIARGVTSISAAAVALIKAETDIERKRVIVIGAGKVGGMTITKLSDMPAKEIILMNRDMSRAQDLGKRHNVTVKDFGALSRELADADIVVAATASDKYLIDRAMVKSATSKNARPLLFIDLGVPRNIEESVRNVPGVRLYNIDDLEPVVSEAIHNRLSEAAKAEEIVRTEAETRYQEYGFADANADIETLVSLCRRDENIVIARAEGPKQSLIPSKIASSCFASLAVPRNDNTAAGDKICAI